MSIAAQGHSRSSEMALCDRSCHFPFTFDCDNVSVLHHFSYITISAVYVTTCDPEKSFAFDTVVTRWKVLWESTTSRESVFVANTWQHLPHLLFCAARWFRISRRSYFVSNRRFTEFFDRYFHIPLPTVTKHELSLSFPPMNLGKNVVEIRPQSF